MTSFYEKVYRYSALRRYIKFLLICLLNSAWFCLCPLSVDRAFDFLVKSDQKTERLVFTDSLLLDVQPK